MAEFIISPYAISFDSIRNNLQDYISSKPNGEAWKDFYASGTGETVVEIAAALGAFYAYQFIMGRREAFLSVAQNYSSAIGLAENLGYSAARGENLQLTLNIVPNQTITLPKWSVIGSYTEYDVVLTEDVILNRGIATNVPIIIGNLMAEEFNITTNKLTQFTFSNPNVTDTCRLLLNDTEVPSSTDIKEALNDKYIMLSNVFGSVDVFYLNNGNYTYMSGDVLQLQFIERNNLTSILYSNSNIIIDYASQVNEFTIVSDRINKESIDNIKIKAPIHHETSMVIRSRRDYSKYILLKNPELIAANDRDITPGLIELTYLKHDGSFMSESEKEKWLDLIEEARPSGVARAFISEPSKVSKTLHIKLWKSQGFNISANISSEIDEVISKYEDNFETDIDLNQIEHDIENLNGVKIARVELDTTEWSANSSFNPYDFVVTPNGDNYYVSEYTFSTGDTEPNWEVNIGDTIIDNEVIWQRVNEFDATIINYWQPNTAVDKYSYIRVDTDGVNEEGNKIVLIFVCSGFVGKTGTIEPEWGEDIITENRLVWQKTNKESTLKWKPNTDFTIGDIITTENDNYVMTRFIGFTGNELPEWDKIENGLVFDGDIIWTLMDSSTKTISLAWNEYSSLDKTYEIMG